MAVVNGDSGAGTPNDEETAAMTIPGSSAGAGRSVQRPRGVRVSLKDEVAAYVREIILSGEILPGAKIDQDEISAILGVSKLPVREALIQVESEGLVQTKMHRGAFVAQITPDDVRDHYHIYGLVCGLAASRAALTLTDEQLDALEGIAEAMEQSRDAELLEQLNVDFHRHINRAGGSRRLLAVLRHLANSLPAHFFESTPGWEDLANKHHREILQRLRARDARGSGEAMVAHVRAGAEFAVGVLASRGYWVEASPLLKEGGDAGGRELRAPTHGCRSV